MNAKQRVLVVLWIVIAIAMFLYPPWIATGEGAVIVDFGYAAFWAPPRSRFARVNVPMLFVQEARWLPIGCIELTPLVCRFGNGCAPTTATAGWNLDRPRVIALA